MNHRRASAVLIYGLPPSCPTQKVRELFERFGTVRSVILSTPSRGHPLLSGYIEMTTEAEAELAVKALHGVPVGDCPIKAYVSPSFSIQTGERAREEFA
jgi:RNA recognition motif-containing protein